MGAIETRLEELGIELRRVFSPPPGVEFSFDLVTTAGGLAYVSGHGPIDGSEVLVSGKVGTERGRHARSAIGAAELPFDMSVEVEAVVELTSA